MRNKYTAVVCIGSFEIQPGGEISISPEAFARLVKERFLPGGKGNAEIEVIPDPDADRIAARHQVLICLNDCGPLKTSELKEKVALPWGMSHSALERAIREYKAEGFIAGGGSGGGGAALRITPAGKKRVEALKLNAKGGRIRRPWPS